MPAEACNLRQLQKRLCIAIGWRRLGSIEKYVKKSNGRERLLKGYIQVLGDIVYFGDPNWSKDRSFDQTPDIFSRLVQIKKDDLVVLIEVGSELTYGRAVVRGIAQVRSDAVSSYYFDNAYSHAHSICPNTRWYEWDRIKMGELQMPQTNFRTLIMDSSQIDVALQGLNKARESESCEST